MERLGEAVRQLHKADALSERDTFLSHLHPVGLLLVTVLYLIALLSFSPYALTGVMGMAVYLVVLYELGELSVVLAWRQLWRLFLLLFLVGIANPFFDREILAYFWGIPVTSGMVSLLVLFLKGSFSLLASYGVAVSVGMNNICYALQCLHFPKLLIVVIMLIYRYLMLFLKESERRFLAYSLRAPGQKGVGFAAWGSLLGGMLLDSINQAEQLYESMQLRGFQGEFFLQRRDKNAAFDTMDTSGQSRGIYTTVLFCISMSFLILLFRFVPVFELAGKLFF